MSDVDVAELVKDLWARLSTGQTNINTLVRAGLAGHIHANFDRVQGGQNVDPENPSRRQWRVVRPGAIILPNLDLDDDDGVDRVRFSYSQADAIVDEKVNAYDDHNDVTEFVIHQPTIAMGNAQQVDLTIDAQDAKRVRILSIPHGENVRHAGVVEVIGPRVGHTHVVWDTLAPHPGQRFIVEALTMVGDPRPGFYPPARTAALPNAPGKFRGPLPAAKGGSEAAPSVNASSSARPVYAKRMPGDIWVNISHRRGPTPVAECQDCALFTIAPWIMTWNTLPCQRVYVAYLESSARPAAPTFEDGRRLENHSMVWELMQGCHAAGLAGAPPVNTSTRIPVSDSDDIHRENDLSFFVIGKTEHGGDRWVQDEFEIGYCYAPHNWLHIAVHNPRERGLGRFVRQNLAHPRLGVFEAVNAEAIDRESTSYGGNLEVSPPVPTPTPALPKDAAGPTIKAHRAAPFGKIIVGDCDPEIMDDELRDFLLAQRVQPVLAVDTSWLTVGHVDEFMTFVRATGSRGFKMLIASVRFMTLLMSEVLKVDPGASIHRGKWKKTTYAETFVDDWVDPGSRRRQYSDRVEREKLSRLRNRLKAGLDLTDEHILPIPTYWELPTNDSTPLGRKSNHTIAENVGMVNMLVVNNHLMVPRPHGPRLPPDQARTVVDSTLKTWFGVAAAPEVVDPASLGPHTFWARPNEDVQMIAMYFCRTPTVGIGDPILWRYDIIEVIEGRKNYSSLTVDQKRVVDALEAKTSAFLPNRSSAFFPDWKRIEIDDGTVDVIELYMKTILEETGNKVHFVENFESYHAVSGEVHCGTNAKRQPPELDPAFTARWWDPGVYDPDYDATYDPDL